MESYINNVNDITYKSELTPPFPTTQRRYEARKSGVKFADGLTAYDLRRFTP